MSDSDDLEIIRPVHDDDDPYDFNDGTFGDKDKDDLPELAVEEAAGVVGKLISNKAKNKVQKQMKADKFEAQKTLKKSGTIKKSVRISEEPDEEVEAAAPSLGLE
mmetsp:Transcript_23076/g.35730  ORF Transcript_23076/g.35730 Transcript_23076/m.35730 type:complete len:105 (-) Transcript_23076:2482-2796(-)